MLAQATVTTNALAKNACSFVLRVDFLSIESFRHADRKMIVDRRAVVSSAFDNKRNKIEFYLDVTSQVQDSSVHFFLLETNSESSFASSHK